MVSPDLPAQKQKFKAAFDSLLRVDAKFLPVVQRKLRKLGLHDTDVFEIVSDVYLRSIRAIEKGTIIENPQAWCHRIAFNIIADKCEVRAKENKHPIIRLDAMEYTDDIEYELASQNLEEDADFNYEILRKKLLRFSDKLDEENQRIFDLRFMQDLSWKEVKKSLVDSGIHLNVATLRKRGQRIRDELKEFLSTDD